MRLNLPDLPTLASAQTVLITGVGGGFDVYCGLPLRHELRRQGKTVHLAGLSFTNTQFLKEAVDLAPGVVGVHADCRSVLLYAPELHLARYLRESDGDDAPIWCFSGTVAGQPLRDAYQALIAHLKPDAIIGIDGGVDSLMRGDEAEVGTIFEDAVSLAALSLLPEVPVRLLACMGMGAENDVAHAHALENIGALAACGGFLGSCALTPQMEAYRVYASAVTYAGSQRGQDPSIINTSVTAAVAGHYGNYHTTEKTKGSRLHLSPLMSLFWFFDLPAVAEACRFVGPLTTTHTRSDAMHAISLVRQLLPPRATPTRFPLP